MRALLTATVVLLLAVPAVALANEERAIKSASPNLQVNVGTTGWTFDVLKMQHRPGWSTVKHIPYGMYTSRDECEIARAKMVAGLDDEDRRQPRLLPDSKATNNSSLTLQILPDQTNSKSSMTDDSKSRENTPTGRGLLASAYEEWNATACHAEAFSTGSGS